MTKILIDESVVRQALETLEEATPHLPVHTDWHFESIAALRQVLEQPAQEPDPDERTIAYMSGVYDGKKRKPLTDEQIDLLINGRGDEDDDDYVEPTGDGFGLTDADLVRLVRRVEAAHGITKGKP